jgi:KaiC/GvpD/RAD55 family RecA-like ATPase
MSAARVSVSPEEVSRFAFQVFTGAARDHAIELPPVVPASRLAEQPAPATVLTGIEELDALTGGVPRGALTEICGPASSGRTSVLLALMVAMTAQAEVCALVDATDSFDPKSAEAAGADLRKLLWIRCSKGRSTVDGLRSTAKATRWAAVDRRPSAIDRLEQALKATDLLLQGGGFGLVIVDLADVPPPAARRVPLTSWFRFRRAVENTRTVLLVIEQEPYAKTCASLVVKLSAARLQAPGARLQENPEPAHARILSGLEITAEILRSATQHKKPVQSAAAFASRAEWAG